MAFSLTLRKSFLYIFATIGLILTIISGVNLINLGLKTFIFTKADHFCYETIPVSIDKVGKTTELTAEQKIAQQNQCNEQRISNQQNQISTSVAMIIVGLPLYFYHWIKINKENQI
jgi:hypothetical protein